jgi:squalene-associated FAD-dependent desaturase
MHVIVVGGGWSGLAAAVELSRGGSAVTLVEAAGRLGGRAARIHHQGRDYDSGQHLLIGAYHGILDLLAAMGVAEAAVFERRRFELISLAPGSAPAWHLGLPALPAPFHLLGGLVVARGVSAADKWSALRFCLTAARSTAPSAADETVEELLRRRRQTPALIDRLWQPLCLAALNTPLHEASAAIFLRVLRAAFAHDRRDSDLLLPRHGLDSVLPAPARHFIENHGGRILLNHRATNLEIMHDKVTAVLCADGRRLAADHVVLALPPPACLRLIEPIPALREVTDRLSRLEFSPICTVYLQYAPAPRLPFPMIGLHGTLAHWLFDLGVSGTPGLMAAVISGPGGHMELDRTVLQERVAAELAACFPHWPAPERLFTLCERRATFLSRRGVDALRPAAETPVVGCWLAGDAAAVGYPATLEGAVRSGVDCARRILQGGRT